MFYEALDRYRGGRERDLDVWPLSDSSCRLLLTFHICDDEYALHYGLTLALSVAETKRHFGAGDDLDFEQVTLDRLLEIKPRITDTRRCRLSHPSGTTYLALMREVGFRELYPTDNGSDFAGNLFDTTPAEQRPKNLEGVDRLLRPGVAVAVEMQASISDNPWISAVR
jgi:hypothetical protein